MARHAQREAEARGDLRLDVGAEVVALVVEVADVALLVHVAQRGEVVEALAAARRGDAVLLGGTRAEDLVDPVGITPAVGAVAHHLHVLRGEDGLLAVHLQGLVVPVGVARTVEELGIGGVERGAVGALVGERHAALLAALGRHDHHAAGTLQTVYGHGGAVLEQRHRLHVVGIDVVDRAGYAVDDVEDARLGAADGHRRLVRTGLARALERDQTRHAAGQTLRDVGHGGQLEVLAVDLRDGRRDVGPALVAVSDHDHLVQARHVLLKGDVDLRNSPPHSGLVGKHADKREDQRALLRHVDRIVALGVGDGAPAGALHHHGYADERRAAFVGYRTPDGLLCEGFARTDQQQRQCQQTRLRCGRIPENREKLFHRIAFKLVIGIRLLCFRSAGVGRGDPLGQGLPPVALDDVRHVEDHQTVGRAQRLGHGARELRSIALVLLHIERPDDGHHAAGELARPLGAALHAVPVALLVGHARLGALAHGAVGAVDLLLRDERVVEPRHVDRCV